MAKSITVYYTESARKDLRKLEKKQARKIVLTVWKYTALKPLIKAKALSGIFSGLYRYRIGDYRAVFEYDGRGVLTIVTILRIKHKKDIYH